MIFDTHAHYDDEAFNEDRDAVLRSLAEHGIEAVVNVGASIQTTKNTLELMKKYDRAESCATVISCVGMKDEYIGSLDPERTYSYFTTVIIKREKR